MRFNFYLLGKILKERRIEKGLSKNRLAQYVGISQPEVTRIENGIRTVPNLITLIYMCEILDLDFINLLIITGYVDNKNLKMTRSFDINKNKINIKRNTELEFIVYARNEKIALKAVQDVLENLDLTDEKINKMSKIIIDVVEEKKDFDDENHKNFCENCKHFCPKSNRYTLEY